MGSSYPLPSVFLLCSMKLKVKKRWVRNNIDLAYFYYEMMETIPCLLPIWWPFGNDFMCIDLNPLSTRDSLSLFKVHIVLKTYFPRIIGLSVQGWCRRGVLTTIQIARNLYQSDLSLTILPWFVKFSYPDFNTKIYLNLQVKNFKVSVLTSTEDFLCVWH